MRIEALPCPSSDNVPAVFSALINRIQTAPCSSTFIEELDRARCQQSIMSKTELGRWAGVLDRCDEILDKATVIEKDGRMSVDYDQEMKKKVVSILKFTALLFECTSTRRVYASMDRLLALLDTSDLTIVADVLRLLQTIGKRSKYLPTRLTPEEQQLLVDKLTTIAQCWGGKLRNMKMVDSLNEDAPIPNIFPFHYSDGKGREFTVDQWDDSKSLLEVVDTETKDMDLIHRYAVLARLRMISGLHKPDHRMHCLIIRLLSISTLIYCRCQQDDNQLNALVFPGFVDETAALLKVPLTKHYLVDQIQAEGLRTLTAIVSLDKTPKVNEILDGLGANSYHGFIANFTRMLVGEIKTGSLGKPGKPSIPLATALFSFIYHVSNNDTGGEKLLSCGLTQTLLSVIEHKELCLDLLSFATRCCRIIDTFTTMDVASFRTMKGMNIFLDRIVHEVNECRKEQPFVIDTSEDTEENQGKYVVVKTPVVDKRCHQLRVGLIKGLLTFVKRVISVPELQESVRHIMEGSFPDALIHIISNAEYYSDSVYHHTLQLVTNFIYQEPAQLTQLQGKHLPYVMLQSMLRKELPNSRDVIGSLGNVFTALCLNEAGLNQFKNYKPFDHIFKILLSIKFLATIKKKRAEMSDSASNIGVSLDDLLRHHPVLKANMLTATINALDMLSKCALEPPANTKIVMAISKIASRNANLNSGGPSGSNSPAVERIADEGEPFGDGFSPREDDSDEDDEADLSMDEVSTLGKTPEDKMGLEMDCPSDAQDGSRIIPLGDYIIIFAKVFEQVISQSSTNSTEIIEGFVQQGGIEKLLELSQIQPIAGELSVSTFTNSIANILQNLLTYKPAGKRMMEAFIEVFSKRASPLLLGEGDEQADGSYLLFLGKDVINEATSCIGTITPILSNLTRLNSGPSQYTIERKGRVHESWLTPTGKTFHQKLRRASRHLSWEATLIKLTENTRVSEGTQTDPVPVEQRKDGEPVQQKEETCVDSVAVEPSVKPLDKSPWEVAGVPQSVVDAWRLEKPVADNVVKANKQILEFLNLLARSCYSPLRRNRRYEYGNGYSQPKQSAQLAEDVFSGIYQELKFTPKEKATSPMEFGRISDALVQLNGVLFDDRRNAFHPMLDKFYSTGLHKAFCDVLTEKLAPALEGQISGQLDAAFGEWFRLADRLANRQKVVNTMYKMYGGASTFDPEKYTRLVQSDFFRVLSDLFTKLSLPSVNLHNYQGLCEEAISVFKEVARSFVPSKFETTPEVAAPRPSNDDNIQNLLEMGFEREEIMVALARCATMEEAAEYLILRQHQQPAPPMPAAAQLQQVPQIPAEEGQPENEAAAAELFVPLALRVPEEDGRSAAGSDEATSLALAGGAAAPIIVPLKELKIDKDISISQACIDLMPLCKRLMELGSDLVFSCADLFISVEPTLDSNWKINELLKNIMGLEVSEMANNVIQQSLTTIPEQKDVITLATRLHFCSLLFEHVAKDYLKIVSDYKLPSLLHSLIDAIEKYFDQAFMHDKLLPPVILYLDLYDKFARLFERRDLLLEAFGTSQNKALVWSWLGDDDMARYRSTKKWVQYNAQTQEIINTAFFDGRGRVPIKKGDKESVVDFGLMLERDSQMPRIQINAELPDDKELLVSMARVLESERKSMWTELEKTDLMKVLTRILRKGVLFTRASWSLLSFLARLTKDKECADIFIKEDGVASLIRLRSSCTPCTAVLLSLILRQCVDTDELYRNMFEKAIRQTTLITPQMEFLGVHDTRPKEWFEALNKLMPLAVRQPEMFADVMSKVVVMKQGQGGNGDLLVMSHVPNKGGNRNCTETNDNMTTMVNLLLIEVLTGEWVDEKNLPLGYSRMLSRSGILNLLSELVKTYQCAAPLITDAKHENQKILLSLLEKYIGHEDKDTYRSLKILIAVLASCNQAPKAQESLVSDIKTCILNICEAPATTESAILHTKLTELCSMISAMAESPNSPSRGPTVLHTSNPILKLFHKKKVCNDLVKTITLLRFNQKEAVDTVAEILRTMEVLMRHINTPAPNAQVDDLGSQVGRARADRGMFSFEEIFQSHLNEDERRRLEELDRRIFHPAHDLNRGLDQLREHVEAMERNFDEALRNGGNGENRAVEPAIEEDSSADERPHDDEMRDDDNSSTQSSEDEPHEGEEEEEDEEEGPHDGADLDLSQDSVEGDAPVAVMEVAEHQDERADEGDTEEDEDDDEDEDGEEDDEDDDDDDDDAYDNELLERDRFEDIYDFGIDPINSFMDDWDVFPQAYLSQFNRTRERRRPNPENAHPLLVRPHHLGEHQGTPAPTGHPYDYANVVLGIQHVGHGGAQLALTRQNAIRRIGGTSRTRPLESRRMFFDRLFDVRDGHGLMSSGMATRDVEDQRLRATVPTALERAVEGCDLLEPVSLRYAGILVNSWVTKAARDQMAEEKADKEKAEEERKRKENEAKAAAKAVVDAAAANAEGGAASSSTTDEASQTAVVVAPPAPEVAQAWSGAEGVLPQQEEPMDVTENNAVHEDASDAPPPSSAATVTSSIPEDEDGSRPASPVRMEESVPAPDTPMDTEQGGQPAGGQPADEPAPAPVAPQEIPEEYRAILGDIVVPDGVDVAFLAALPDDMRAEVLRDHERQQRAQRAAVAPAQPAAGQDVPVPVVEPLDQEFLNALPPELQEEILQQHERAVREAEEAIRRANEPAPPAQPEMDGAAVIASLPSRERQQVLAEMDEAELQRLPQAMQDEARRARVHMQNVFEPVGLIHREIQRNVMRIHNLYVRQGRGPLRANGTNASGSVGISAGRTYTANTQAMQLLDRESIIILCGLFLVDHRINSTRLQKVIRLICSHAPSCEFVIWCLQGFLDKASEGSNFDADDIVSTGPGWLDSIGVPGLGLGERCAKIAKNGSKVYVNPLISPSICRNVVETLNTLARCYPGHFLPTVLRNEQIECKNWPERSSFWQLLQNPSGKALGKEPVDSRPAAEQFATCPFTHFFHYFNKKLFHETGNLQDKLFRVINTIAQTLPDNVIHRLGLPSEAAPVEEEVKLLIEVLSQGICGPDGFVDGRSTMMEMMRVLSPAISDIIYDSLCETISSIGHKLQPQIEQLMVEMNGITESPEEEEPTTSSRVVDKGRVTSARLAGPGIVVDGDVLGKLKMSSYACAELRLPAMMALTDKHGAQYTLLSSLQTLTKLRDTMRQRKQKRIDEEKKKVADAAAAVAAAAAPPQAEAPPAVTATVEGQDNNPRPAAAAASPAEPEAQPEGQVPASIPSTSAASEKTQDKQEAANLELINVELPTSRLSERLSSLEELWKAVSAALLRLGKASDPHAVLALQPAAEAFFLAHAVPKSAATDNEHPDNQKMIEFAEMHREVLNQVLRQNSQALSPGGPFAFLTQFPKLLDFDVKRKYFRKELTKMDNDREYRRADINVQVRRQHLFSDSFRELYRLRPAEWKKRFYIVFQGEEGQDAGGLLREWFSVITREIFNPNYALFITAPGDMVTYMINKASYINPEHLDYFKFVGKLIAKAIYDNKLLDCYFTRAFYKHILNVPVRYQDIESEDPAFFKSLEFLLENPINDLGLDLTFSLEVEEFGVRSIRDLKPNGRKIDVTDENKVEYVNLVCQMKMTGSIQKQLDAFLSGFYEIIPKSLISMFNEQELELLISGLPDVDIDDLANNTEYKSYTKTSPQIQWFWRALRSFEPEDRAKFLQFVTGTSKVPLQGFATLEGMNGVQKFSIHMDSRGGDRLPAAHTCFNQLDLPQYESYEKLRDHLLTAIRECTTGFGFA